MPYVIRPSGVRKAHISVALGIALDEVTAHLRELLNLRSHTSDAVGAPTDR